MKNIFTEDREVKQPKLYQALISFAGLMAVMSVGIVVFEVDPHIPMFIGVIISAIMAMV
ncbi:MAG: Na+/H+ antiporter NhaC, partial [Clostridiales bacterium]|nr:Na+/H+ antiporter NhaC [Clostridiales bacterium]